MKATRLITALAGGLLLGGLSAQALAAPILYGTTGSGRDNISNLITIDLATGSTTLIGSIGYGVNGLTYDATTGTLFGSVSLDGGLISINTTTGAGTMIGTGFNSPAVGCSSVNVLLTADSGGDLYGWCDPGSDDLMTIDKTTGLATAIVGDSGIGTGGHGMAFDNNDALYLYQGADLYSISTVTGVATFVANTGQSNAHHGDFNPANNFYYGVGNFGPGGTLLAFDFGATNTLQDSITLDRSDVFTLAFTSEAVETPEPATLGLLGLGLVAMGYRRRQQTRA